jgi:hypothetical protein
VKLVVEVIQAKVTAEGLMLFVLPDEEMLHLPAEYCEVINE